MANALDLLADAPSPLTPIAGGTDLLVSWHHRPHDNLNLLDLSRLTELRPPRLTADALELGALTTYWDILASPEISAAFPLLADAARVVGAIQIQTRGTWAGNIANGSPAADGVPVLMAYDAVVRLASQRGVEQVPLDQFYTGYRTSVRRPDQLITSIHLPRRPRTLEWFHKVGARSAQAITKVGVVMVQDASPAAAPPPPTTHSTFPSGDREEAVPPTRWRIVANSVAPTILRCRTLESQLESGHQFTSPDEIETVLKPDIAPITDIRSTAAYRLRVLARLIHWKLSER